MNSKHTNYRLTNFHIWTRKSISKKTRVHLFKKHHLDTSSPFKFLSERHHPKSQTSWYRTSGHNIEVPKSNHPRSYSFKFKSKEVQKATRGGCTRAYQSHARLRTSVLFFLELGFFRKGLLMGLTMHAIYYLGVPLSPL